MRTLISLVHRLVFSCLVLATITQCASANEVAIELRDAQGDGVAFAQTTADSRAVQQGDSLRIILPTAIEKAKGNRVLELEYFCVGEVEKLTVEPDTKSEPRFKISLPAMRHSEAFRPYVARLTGDHEGWPERWSALRVAFEMKPETRLEVRNVKIRLEKPGDFDSKTDESGSGVDSASLDAYLKQTFDAQITSVIVGNDEISVAGTVVGDASGLVLGDLSMETLLGRTFLEQTTVPIVTDEQGRFLVNLPRHVARGGRQDDRLTDRWQIYRRQGEDLVAASHARYADQVPCRSPRLPAATVSSKKGLGGWSSRRSPELQNELETLGIAAVTVNLAGLHHLVSTTAQAGLRPFAHEGKTYYVDEARLKTYDDTFREAQRHGAMVSAILLISNPLKTSDSDAKLLGHPDAVMDGVFAHPNVTSREGIEYYGAILSVLADRWSRDDGVHGRVHHWIIHNEIDFGWIWTNAGTKSDIAYMDLYQRSMRLTHLIARQYDPHAKAFISLTHHWADRGTEYGYGSKRMVDLLVEFCKAEGDFDWGLAYHPYPQNLFNPRTWEDSQATFDFNTKKITPKNIEVLDAYMKLPALRFQGEVRTVHLSENGFNSKDYSAKSLEDQAAGMALAWKKIAALSSIESWQYHNWIDNRGEGGLRIGLRRFPDDADQPLGTKPVWQLYKALGNPEEDIVAAPYLKTIGIQSWDECRYTASIE